MEEKIQTRIRELEAHERQVLAELAATRSVLAELRALLAPNTPVITTSDDPPAEPPTITTSDDAAPA